MKNFKKNSGITLIALIITIIILLILAVVTIMAVNGDGIIGKAKQAREEYQNAQAEEQNILDKYLAEMEGLGSNNTLPGGEEQNPNISSYEDGVPIPVGFKFIEGTKDSGLVVENEADGSQFVWVPVTETISEYGIGTEDFREPDVITQEIESYDGSNYTYKDGADNSTTYLNIIKYILGVQYNNSDEFLAVLQEDFNLMAESVNKNGGFYVGRYETSLKEENGKKVAQSVSGVLSATAEESSANRWYGLYAYQKAYSTESVQGSMIWGSQYDRMMTWMGEAANTTISGRNQSRVTGSEEYLDDVINNVYDLYGNSFEWTLEAYNTIDRVYRGGYCLIDTAPSYRNPYHPTSTYNNYGSRLALYIK